MKPFDLEAAKRGEPIAYARNPSYAIIFIGVRQDGSIVYEDTDGHLASMRGNGLCMAEPPRPEWQQDLIDAVESGKIVEFNPLTPDCWQTSELNRYSSSYDFRGSTEDQFRIRPKKVTRYLWSFKYPAIERWVQSNIFMSNEEVKEKFPNRETQRLDWSETQFEE